MTKPSVPVGLGKHRAGNFWRDVDALQKVVDAEPPMIKGSMGQMVVHPARSELRQVRMSLKAMLASLKLPDGQQKQTRSEAARTAANARWSQRGA